MFRLLPILLFGMGCIAEKTEDSSSNTDTEDECEILEEVSCWDEENSEEIECPEGYSCSGLSAFWCYKGACDNLPECLPASTRIATPVGELPIAALKVGDAVWTRNAEGAMVSALLEQVDSFAVPEHHRVLSISLKDGRQLRASPKHPDDKGSPLVALSKGDLLDGSIVDRIELIPYGERRTYDILPAGETGLYQANGVWLGSTLQPKHSVKR